MAGIDPQVLANATVRASAFAYYMDGMLASSMVDVSDPAALTTAFEQDTPAAEKAVNAWFMTVDPSTISAADDTAGFQCLQQYGCPYSGRCINPGSWHIESTVCYVNNCGDSKCTACPDWFPDMLKHLVFKSWCAYVCTGSGYKVPAPVVARGVVGIVAKTGQPFPANGLVWCLEP